MRLYERDPTLALRNELVKRGGGDGGTLTLSVYPTTRPSSAYNHGKPKPTVGGSFGGFLGLVIGLGLFAIITSTAAFFLYRRYKRNKNYPGGASGGGFGFGKGKGLFGKKKNKGWVQTHSYTEDDDDGIRLDPHQQARGGRPYEDPFNAESHDDLHPRQSSAQIDHGPEYHPVSTRGERAKSPPPFQGGTKFRESL